MLYYFLTYAAVAYAWVSLTTLIKFTHFLWKFRVLTLNELGRTIWFFWFPPLLLSLLTFPFEVITLYVNRNPIERAYAYEAACAIFNMKYEQLHFAYRVRHYEKIDIEDF